MSNSTEIVQVLRPVIEAFLQSGVRYYVGGSVASSYHGAMRSTMDVDVVAELEDAQVADWLYRLGDRYYASEPAIRQAIARRGSFNLIHYETSFKVDVFISRGRQYDRSAFARCIAGYLGDNEELQAKIASPEDVIISKLEWYRLGNETSERQWRDVTMVLQVLGEKADVNYLRESANLVGIDDLLNKLLEPTTG